MSILIRERVMHIMTIYLTLWRVLQPFPGNAENNFSLELLPWFSWANQLESFFLVPVPRASHWLVMAL